MRNLKKKNLKKILYLFYIAFENLKQSFENILNTIKTILDIEFVKSLDFDSNLNQTLHNGKGTTSVLLDRKAGVCENRRYIALCLETFESLCAFLSLVSHG